MDVLIVGGTRFVGYQLVWKLIAGGNRVTLLNRGTHPDPFGGRVDRVRADRSSPAGLAALGKRSFDACVDFAVYNGDDARRTVSALAGRVGHYVMISTGQVYLVLQDRPKLARESDYDGPLMPEPADPAEKSEWDYGVGKRAAEDVLTAAWESSAFPSTRLRIPMVNGERDYYRRVEGYLWRLLDGGPLLLPDGGAGHVRHVYSGSVVAAVVSLLGDSKTFGQAYNLAQDETPTVDHLVKTLAWSLGTTPATVGVPEAAVVEAGLDPVGVSPFSGRWASFLDPARARTELGFRHEPLARYLDKIVTCFLNHPPPDYPEPYARRADELRLASHWSS